jgi:hypothetical protein
MAGLAYNVSTAEKGRKEDPPFVYEEAILSKQRCKTMHLCIHTYRN